MNKPHTFNRMSFHYMKDLKRAVKTIGDNKVSVRGTFINVKDQKDWSLGTDFASLSYMVENGISIIPYIQEMVNF